MKVFGEAVKVCTGVPRIEFNKVELGEVVEGGVKIVCGGGDEEVGEIREEGSCDRVKSVVVVVYGEEGD